MHGENEDKHKRSSTSVVGQMNCCLRDYELMMTYHNSPEYQHVVNADFMRQRGCGRVINLFHYSL